MRSLVRALHDRPVLISGRGSCAEVAHLYGLRRSLTTTQLGAAMPSSTPFSSYPAPSHASSAGPCPVADLGLGSEAAPIEAVLVMNDPDDWWGCLLGFRALGL
jgi:hypothetical protein